MIEVMNLMKQRKPGEINSPGIHQRVLNSIHKVSQEEISRTANALSLITQHLKTKKEEKQPKDIVPVYLVFWSAVLTLTPFRASLVALFFSYKFHAVLTQTAIKLA